MPEPKETHGKYTINGKEYDILGYVSPQGDNVPKETTGAVPLLDIKMMSDFKWQYGCLMSRIEHPEHYMDIDTDVNAVIEKLKQWLIDHIEHINDLKPEEQIKLMSLLAEKAA